MHLALRLLASFAIGLCCKSAIAAGEYGTFDGPVVASWNADGRTMTIAQDFIYTDPLGVKWTARKGAKVDGASIPSWLWPLAGTPFVGKYRDPSVVHDVACQERARPWESVHLAFYFAMLAAGVDEASAKLMYGAVYLGGPRWSMLLRATRRDEKFGLIVDAISQNASLRTEAGASNTVFLRTVQGMGQNQRVETVVAPTTEKIRIVAANPSTVEVLAEFKSPAPPLVNAEQWQRVKAFIESRNRSLEEIRAFKP